MEVKGSLKSLKPAFIGKLRHLFSSRAGLAGLAVLTLLTALAFNPASVTSAVGKLWRGSDLNIERRGHTATPLADGRLLIVGGENEHGPVAEVEIFDPRSRTFSLAARSIIPRADHTATKLSDGRVMIIGGRSGDGLLDSTEIYDPAADSFSHGVALNYARAGHSATTLADGRILVVGGAGEGSVEIFDPDRQVFTPVEARLRDPRSAHAAALLASGKLLIAGGGAADGSPVLSAEIFDPETMSFSAARNSMHIARTRPLLRVLPDGKVQVIGGDEEMTMEMFNPESAHFTAFAHLLDDPKSLPAVLRTHTRAALVHARNAFAVGPPRAVIPDAAIGARLDRNGYSLTELPLANQAVVVGGTDSSGKFLKSAVSLSSSTATVTTDKTDYTPGETVIITGAGWLPGETVRMVLHEEPATHPDLILNSVADASGNFTNSSFVVEPDDVGVTFTLTATGQTSGWTAQTTFTDASPGSLGNYATAGLLGITANVSPSFVAAGVSFSTLERGAGLAGASFTGAFNSSSWQTGSPLVIAGNTDYYEFTITPDSCRKFSASELRVGLARSATGPASAEFRSSLDSYGSTIGSVITVPTTLATFTINLSLVSGLQNQASAVTFRIYGYNATGSTGTMRIQNVASPVMVGLEIDGAVATNDTTPPTITCPADIQLQCGASTDPANTGVATATDNCAGSVTATFTDAATPAGCAGTPGIDRTWKATDANGNMATCVQHITFVDTTPPVIGAPGANATIECPATPVFTPPPATDACDPNPAVSVVSDVTTPGSCPGVYSRTITWKATDACGNMSGTVSQTINVVDTTPPVIGAPGADATIECPTSPVFTPPTSTDACDPSPVVSVVSDVTTPGSCASAYSRTITWKATDCAGNMSGTVSQTITVRDTTAPTVTFCPADQTIQCPSTPSFGTPTFSDTCDTSLTVTFVDETLPASCPAISKVKRTWTAKDDCNNSVTCSQTITVQDTTAPTVTFCPSDQTIECPTTPTFGAPTFSDACDTSLTVTFADEELPATCPAIRVVKRTWTAKDDCDNSVTCSQTVTVRDTTAPTVTFCPADQTIQCPSTPSFGTPTFSDTCDTSLTVTFVDETLPAMCPAVSKVKRTWTAKDDCNNSVTCSQTITVEDRTAPNITCPSPIIVGQCNNVVTFAPSVTDACNATPTAVCTPPSGTAFPVGTTTVTCTATDDCSNSRACSFDVTVIANPSCSITPPAQPPGCGTTGNTLTATVNGTGTLTGVWSLDAAAIAAGWAITAGQASNTITYTAGSGTATFKLVATDSRGCMTMCTLNVTCASLQTEFCTLSQGAYGNRNGRFNGIRRDALIAQLLNGTPLTLGKAGARSITFSNNSTSTVNCIFNTMPAGGPPSALPSGLNASVPPCSALTPATGGKGRFRNVLIGQVLALSFNVRLDTHGLGSWTLCRTFTTKRALPGQDGLLGTGDDVIDPSDPGQTFTIPSSVLPALTSLSLSHTVNGLLELANRGLAGLPTGGASLSDINAAVSAINEGFDECRFLISCTTNGVVNLNAPNSAPNNVWPDGFLKPRLFFFEPVL